jgi:hypothetical protein
MRRSKDAYDKCFEVSTADRTISSRSLYSMKFIKKVPQDEKWMEMTTAESERIRDFPSIIKENDPEILAGTIAAYVIESGDNSKEEVVPVKVKGKKAKAVTVSEAAAGKAKQHKAAKKKRSREETIITKEHLEHVLDDIVEEKDEPKKKKKAAAPIFTPMIEVTPDMEKKAKEQADQMLVDQRRKEAQYK